MSEREILGGDVVRASVRGRLFHAHVQSVAPDGSLIVAPIELGIRLRRVQQCDVLEHWRTRRVRGVAGATGR